jgi:hypothetical protein
LPSQRPPDLPWALAGERATNSVPIWIPVALPPPILPRLVLWAGFERDVCARCELHRPNCQGYQTIDMSVERPTKFGLSIGRPLRPSASSCRLPFNCAQLRSSSDGWMAPVRMEACARASVRSPAGLEWRHRQSIRRPLIAGRFLRVTSLPRAQRFCRPLRHTLREAPHPPPSRLLWRRVGDAP